jgi:hypothetical protein
MFLTLGILIPRVLQIDHLDGSAVRDRSANNWCTPERKIELPDGALGYRAYLGDKEEPVVKTSID